MSMPPQVRDEEWFTRFKAELQLRGATGREIGEAVAEVVAEVMMAGTLA